MEHIRLLVNDSILHEIFIYVLIFSAMTISIGIAIKNGNKKWFTKSIKMLQPHLSCFILGYFITNIFRDVHYIPFYWSYIIGGIFCFIGYEIFYHLKFKRFCLKLSKFHNFGNHYEEYIEIDNIDLVNKWCKDNCRGVWIIDYVTICFNLKSDYAMFKLFYSGLR